MLSRLGARRARSVCIGVVLLAGCALLIGLFAFTRGAESGRAAAVAGHALLHPTAPAYSRGLCRANDAANVTRAADEILASEIKDLYPVARQVYLQRIRQDPTDSCATQGLATLTAAEKAAKDEATSAETAERTRLQSAKASWDSWSKKYTTPSGAIASVCAALLALLLILARLATPLVVSPQTQPTRERHRKLIWGAGLLLTFAASTTPFLVADSALANPGATWPVVTLLATAIVLWLLEPQAGATSIGQTPAHRQSQSSGWNRVRLLVGIVGILATVSEFLTTLGAPSGLQLSALIAGASSAIIGTALVSLARGLALALRVQVFSTQGAADVAAGRLMVARLENLGSQRPAGLLTAEGTDVTDLPADALTSVPSGVFAKTLFDVLRLVTPGSPWRVEVTFTSSETISVTVSRNRVAVPNGSLIISIADFPDDATYTKSSTEEGAVAVSADNRNVADELLTAAAAHVLMVLSQSHTQLKTGMCGADTWSALAMHAIAARGRSSDSRRVKLLERAIDGSPNYLLARLALLNTMAEDSADAWFSYANHLDDLWADFGERLGGNPRFEATVLEPDDGYDATQLRMLINRSISWLNVYMHYVIDHEEKLSEYLSHAANQDGECGPDHEARIRAWARSAAAAMQLRTRWGAVRGKDELRDIVDEMELTSAYLLLDLHFQRVDRHLNLKQPFHRVVNRLCSEVRTQARLLVNLPPATEASGGSLTAAADDEVDDRLPECLNLALRPRSRYDYYSLACVLAGRQGAWRPH